MSVEDFKDRPECDMSLYETDKLWFYPRHCLSEQQYCNETFYEHRTPYACRLAPLQDLDTLSIVVFSSAIAIVGIFAVVFLILCIYANLQKRSLLQQIESRRNEIALRRQRRLVAILLNERRANLSSWQNAVRSLRSNDEFVRIMDDEMDTFATPSSRSTTTTQPRSDSVGNDRSSADDEIKKDDDDFTNAFGSETYFEPLCAICLTEVDEGEQEFVRSSNKDVCHHVFHKSCIIEWFSVARNPSCPCCRHIFVNKERLRVRGIEFEEEVEISSTVTEVLAPDQNAEV